MKTKEYNKLLANFSADIRSSTLKRLEEVPNGFINWRLNNTAMSFVDIVQHLINVDELFFSITTTGKKNFKWTLGTDEPHLIVDEPSYNAILVKLKEFQLKRNAIISKLDDAKMHEDVTDNNEQKMTLWQFIMHNLIEHEVYHRGQIAAYLKVIKGESSEI